MIVSRVTIVYQEPHPQLLESSPLTLILVSKSEEIFVREEVSAPLVLPEHTAVLQVLLTTLVDRAPASVVLKDIFVREVPAILILSWIVPLDIIARMGLNIQPNTPALLERSIT